MTITCPWCNSSAVDAEYVDIGVGEQRVTSYTCEACGAQELNPYHDNSRATVEELNKGWWKGPPKPSVEVARDVQAPAPAERLLHTCADCTRNTDRLKSQERRIQEARVNFEAAAKRITDENAQLKRTVITLQEERRWESTRNLDTYQRDMEALRTRLTKEVNDLRAQLEKALGKKIPEEVAGVSRFSLLEVD
jgi:hypothetical protein